jgi:hypothetical protein
MAVSHFGNKPFLETEGEVTNPSDNDVVADTGALLPGIYEVRVTLGASAAAHYALQRRNAANDANVGVVPILYAAAGQSGQYVFRFSIETGERVVVAMDDALTGTASVILQWERLS